MAAPKLDFARFLDDTVIPNLRPSSSANAAAAEVDVVLLTCMDFRYPERIVDTMERKGLKGKYDHLILAGASLGVVLKPEWQKTFFDQLRFAVEKHGASQVIVLDHRDCGAFKEYRGVTPDDPAKELEAHRLQCEETMKLIVKEIPTLAGRVHGLLLPIEKVDDLGGA